jgi:hypothetical protein
MNYKQDLYITLKTTDTFHPINTDGELDDCIEQGCDKNELAQAVYACLEEMMDKVRSYYENPWNFSSGYQPPSKLFVDPATDLEDIAFVIANKILEN